jgi:hypothetical protein
MSSTASKLAALRGLEGAKLAVEKLLSTGTETHAVLFYGAAGAGKRSLAALLAQGWLCSRAEGLPRAEGLRAEGGGSDGDGGDGLPGCGECRNCLSLARGNHPDILRIQPIGPSSLIKIGHFLYRPNPPKEEEHILALEIFLRSAPLVSRRKVVVIEDAHRMNSDSANAFLKTLEEPPPFARIVMTTSSLRQLPATILSRCMAIACELPSSPADGDIDLWRLALGAPGRASRLSDQADAYLAIDRFAAGLSHRPAAEAPLVADQFRAIAEAIAIPGGARAVNAEAVATLATAIRYHHPDRPEWAHLTVEAHRRILGNGSAGYTLDALFCSMLAG